MGNSKVKVLYIAGYERSGSTLLHNVLGQLDGFFAAGELAKIWDRSLIENRRCGCGAPFKECEVWREILTNGFGGAEWIRAHEMVRARDSVRSRHFPLALLPWNEHLLKSRLGSFPEHLARLYRAIQSTTGSRVVIDSSKSPMYAYVLGRVPEVELYVVHLVRDPRSVQYSLLKRKAEEHGGYLKHNSVKGSLAWDTLNLVAEGIWRDPRRYVRLRFEDFVSEPRGVVERILDMTQEKVERLPFTSTGEVELHPTHSRGGSPSRFETGTIELRVDETWKQKMKPSDKAVVTALTRPLLSRYGYSAGGRSAGS
ncbi:MAG: sulfotransferase [Rubrobacter sp.]